MCIPLCTTVVHHTVQNISDIFFLLLLTSVIAQTFVGSDEEQCPIKRPLNPLKLQLWMHYLVSISHFANCRENQLVTVSEMQMYHLKSDLESVSGIISSPKVNRFNRLLGPIITPSLCEIG